jgi:CheY-like chemotaxis protein
LCNVKFIAKMVTCIQNNCKLLSDGEMFHVVVMDYQMPNMDGPTAIKAIRKLGYRGMIIGLTGNAMQCDQDT